MELGFGPSLPLDPMGQIYPLSQAGWLMFIAFFSTPTATARLGLKLDLQITISGKRGVLQQVTQGLLLIHGFIHSTGISQARLNRKLLSHRRMKDISIHLERFSQWRCLSGCAQQPAKGRAAGAQQRKVVLTWAEGGQQRKASGGR